MHLKKRIVSLALAAAIMVSVSAPALATSAFDKSVFNNRQDISISDDEMDGITIVTTVPDYFKDSIVLFDNAFVLVDPKIGLVDNFDLYSFYFDYYGANYAGLKSIIIKIGDNRYTFSNCQHTSSLTSDNFIHESISFSLKRETVKFMSDFAEHRNEKIQVRLVGNSQNLDFILTDDMKNSILTLYDLYSRGGGTRDKNMRNITLADSVVVSKNGEVIDGLVKEKMVDAGFQILGALSSTR